MAGKPVLRSGLSRRRRFSVLERDRYRCRYCGAEAWEERLVIAHVVPVAKGGTDDESNLVVACQTCNASGVPDVRRVA